MLAALLAGTVVAQDSGVLTGQVLNGTAGGPEVGAGLDVTLRVFRGEAELNTFATETDSQGSFVFEELDTDPTLVYVPEVVYLGVVYQSMEPYRFEGGAADLTATLSVFETTDDDSAVAIDSVHLIAESFGQMLRISEIHLFGNGIERTYIGKDGQIAGTDRSTVYIPLPEEAVGVAFQGESAGERFLETDGGMLDTEPVPPGPESSLAFFSYHLVVAGETVPLERWFAYPVSNLSILVAQPGLKLQSEQLGAMGSQEFEGKQYELYVAGNLDANAPLALEFIPMADVGSGSGMTVPWEGGAGAPAASSRGSQGILLWLGMILAVLAVVGVTVYAVGARQSPARSVRSPALDRGPQGRRLLAELADLEDAFAAGEIDESSYESQRARTYDALRALSSD
jgi:hypothetical protein